MKPFILKQHEKDYAALRELRADELNIPAGGLKRIPKLNTITSSPAGTSGDDGADEH